MATADIMEKDMTKVNLVSMVRGLDESGNSVLISALKLVSSVSLINKGLSETEDMLNVGNAFGYSRGNVDGSGIDGVYLSIEPIFNECVQIKFAYDLSSIKIRSSYGSQVTWTNWKSISLT